MNNHSKTSPRESSALFSVGHHLAHPVHSPVAILGMPFDKVTTNDALDIFGGMIASGKPHYVVTPNVDFAVQAQHDRELRRILAGADLVLCDGMPLVWASRVLGNALPERVTGSDIVPKLLQEAARRQWRVFFLGGSEGSVALAAQNATARFPGLQMVGAYSPPFKPLPEMNHEEILCKIRAAQPDILLVAFGCPKQEKWISQNYQAAGVPLCIGVGATIDFLAGKVQRAPRWMQRSGMEWLFRLLQEPRRLFRRYYTDLKVFTQAVTRQWWKLRPSFLTTRPGLARSETLAFGDIEFIRCSGRLDAETVHRFQELWSLPATNHAHLLLDLSEVKFIDSSGVGVLIRSQKQLNESEKKLILIAPSPCVRDALSLMRLTSFFAYAKTRAEARTSLLADTGKNPARPSVATSRGHPHVAKPIFA